MIQTAQEAQKAVMDRTRAYREALEQVSTFLEETDTLYLVERARSRTGATATYSAVAIDDDYKPVDLTEEVGILAALPVAPSSGYLQLLRSDRMVREVASAISDVLGYEISGALL